MKWRSMSTLKLGVTAAAAGITAAAAGFCFCFRRSNILLENSFPYDTRKRGEKRKRRERIVPHLQRMKDGVYVWNSFLSTEFCIYGWNGGRRRFFLAKIQVNVEDCMYMSCLWPNRKRATQLPDCFRFRTDQLERFLLHFFSTSYRKSAYSASDSHLRTLSGCIFLASYLV